MAALEIHLQKGFSRDNVIVWVNGGEIAEKLAVTTNRSGLAAVIGTDVPEGRVLVRITIPSRRVVEDVAVDVSQTPFLAVGLPRSGRRLEATLSPLPFQYV